ncbi:hypothetical protein AUJ13_04580 [Candidatus Micrarchaeota archaeon CG1_02_49_24]|nr:MAG: hypothetical protein AUJ13_04580 [Candidatus Micrarchaeota archaeon CG1_02_49_24]
MQTGIRPVRHSATHIRPGVSTLKGLLFETIMRTDGRNTSLVKAAVAKAEKLHAGQARVFEGTEYINHLLRAAAMAAHLRIWNGHGIGIRGGSFASAGVLHDALEDGDIAFRELKGLFGPKIANMVAALTRPVPAEGRIICATDQEYMHARDAYRQLPHEEHERLRLMHREELDLQYRDLLINNRASLMLKLVDMFDNRVYPHLMDVPNRQKRYRRHRLELNLVSAKNAELYRLLMALGIAYGGLEFQALVNVIDRIEELRFNKDQYWRNVGIGSRYALALSDGISAGRCVIYTADTPLSIELPYDRIGPKPSELLLGVSPEQLARIYPGLDMGEVARRTVAVCAGMEEAVVTSKAEYMDMLDNAYVLGVETHVPIEHLRERLAYLQVILNPISNKSLFQG